MDGDNRNGANGEYVPVRARAGTFMLLVVRKIVFWLRKVAQIRGGGPSYLPDIVGIMIAEDNARDQKRKTLKERNPPAFVSRILDAQGSTRETCQ